LVQSTIQILRNIRDGRESPIRKVLNAFLSFHIHEVQFNNRFDWLEIGNNVTVFHFQFQFPDGSSVKMEETKQSMFSQTPRQESIVA
jgi:hypothetical protein